MKFLKGFRVCVGKNIYINLKLITDMQELDGGWNVYFVVSGNIRSVLISGDFKIIDF